MPTPFLSSLGALATSPGTSLVVSIGSSTSRDLVLLYTENRGASVGSQPEAPAPPDGFSLLDSVVSSTLFRAVYWAKGGQVGASTTLQIPELSGSGGSWYAYADVIRNVSYRSPGWLDFPGTSGDYARIDRTDLAGLLSGLGFQVRVQFNELDTGSTQWLAGWANGSAGFGINDGNHLIIFVDNAAGNPIGNVESPVEIPGLEVGDVIWLMATVDADIAQCQYWYSFENEEDVSRITWQFLDSPNGSNPSASIGLVDSDTVFIGARDAATSGFDGNIFHFAEFIPFGLRTVDVSFSDDLPVDMTLVGGDVEHVTPSGDDGFGDPIEDFGIGQEGEFLGGFYLPARAAYGPNRIAYNAWVGYAATHSADPVHGPETWTAYSDRAVTTQDLAQKVVTRTILTDLATGDHDASEDGHYTWTYFGLTIKGRSAPILYPASPQPDNVVLGCADSYTVSITDNTYDNPIEQIGWESLSWERVLDDISQAKVVSPDRLGGIDCLADNQLIEPWRYGVLIERNDGEVWKGPIVTVGRRGDAIEIGAADVLARYQKRFVTRIPADFIDTDSAVAFREVIETYAGFTADPWTLEIPDVSVGVTITRHLNPREFKYAWDFLSELLDSSVDAYVMNGRLYMWEPDAGWRYHDVIKRTLPGPYNTNFDFVYGTFTEEAWTTRPNWSIDGAGQSNYNVVPSADSGEFGFRTYELREEVTSQALYGVLDGVDPDPLELPEDSEPADVILALMARAETMNALRAIPPIVMEGGELSQNAPVDVDNLRPGSLWKVDTFDHGYGQLLTVGRLRRVSVSVTKSDRGIEEKVSPTLYPPGWEGEL